LVPGRRTTFWGHPKVPSFFLVLLFNVIKHNSQVSFRPLLLRPLHVLFPPRVFFCSLALVPLFFRFPTSFISVTRAVYLIPPRRRTELFLVVPSCALNHSIVYARARLWSVPFNVSLLGNPLLVFRRTSPVIFSFQSFFFFSSIGLCPSRVFFSLSQLPFFSTAFFHLSRKSFSPVPSFFRTSHGLPQAARIFP